MTKAELLDKLERIKKNSVIPDKQKQQLIELYNQKLAALGEPSDYQKELKRQVEAGEIEDTSKGISLYHMSENIDKKKSEAKEKVEKAPAKEKKERKPRKAKAKKAKPAKKAAVSEAKPKGTGKRGRPAKAKPETVASEPKKEKHVITVDGKEYDIDDCKEAISAWKARKEQASKTNKQYKTKSPSVKAKDNVEDAIDHIGDSISNKKIQENPKKVISALRMFKKKMDEAFTTLNPILKEVDVKRLKSALAEIEEVIKSIEK